MIEKSTPIKNELREKMNKVEEDNGITLTNTQKMLLCVRGPITNMLDILYGDVSLFMLDQHFEKADERIAELVNISAGDQIDYREVIVHKSGKPLVYALSYIPTSRCSEGVLEDLKKEKLTTGKIIDKNKLETIRVINEIYIETPSSIQAELFKTQDKLLTREYVMIHDGKVIIWTKESCPIIYFEERHNDF